MLNHLLRPSKLKWNFATRKFILPLSTRRFSSSWVQDGDSDFSDEHLKHHAPVTTFTEDEMMTRDAVRAWAREDLGPVVREMDNEGKLRKDIVDSLFSQGFMGMEIPEGMF